MSTRRPDSLDVQLSKTLAYLLRHGAVKEKLPIRADGYIAIAEILKHKNLKKFTAADIDRVVASNDKQRFAIDVVDGQQCIRANQGHSISAVAVETKKITALADLPTPVVVHGTYKRFWAAIKQTGLSRMNRNHIHFAIGTPESEQVISGMRTTSEVLIYIDMEGAIAAGLPFEISANNVVLSPGNPQGYIPTSFFKAVLDAKTKAPFDPEFPNPL